MKRQYVWLFVSYFICTTACSKDRSAEKQVGENTFHVTCEDIKIPFLIGNNVQLLSMDSLLLFNDFSSDPLVTLYDPKNDSVVATFLRKGRGPGEVFPPVEIHALGDSIYIHDRNSNTLFSSIYDIEKLSRNDYDATHRWRSRALINTIIPLDHTKFIASGAFSNARFVLMNSTGDVVESFGEYPAYMSGETALPDEGKSMFHQSFFLRSPTKSKIVAYASHVLEIYDLQNDRLVLENQVLLSPYEYTCTLGDILRADASQYTKRGVISGQCDDEFIYLLFSYREGDIDGATEIWVFDWAGQPVACISPDKKIVSFSVDRIQNVIYAIDDLSELNRIDVNFIEQL